MALAEKAEELMDDFLDNRCFRTGLRTIARHHWRAAWQHLEMARRAEAARRTGCEDFDLADVVSASPYCELADGVAPRVAQNVINPDASRIVEAWPDLHETIRPTQLVLIGNAKG